jgi:hypothetical protein
MLVSRQKRFDHAAILQPSSPPLAPATPPPANTLNLFQQPRCLYPRSPVTLSLPATHKEEFAYDCYSFNHPHEMATLQGSIHALRTSHGQASSQHALQNNAERHRNSDQQWSTSGGYYGIPTTCSQTMAPCSMARLIVLCPRRMRACYATTKALSIPFLSFVAAFCHVSNSLKLTTINSIP